MFTITTASHIAYSVYLSITIAITQSIDQLVPATFKVPLCLSGAYTQNYILQKSIHRSRKY